MQEELLPLFPLAAVLLPGSELPLHIFEDRYKEMIGEALDHQSEFGVVLAASGGIVAAGCTAGIEQVLQRYSDGRLDILTRGRRRFEIQSLNDTRAFLRAAVAYFDDEEPDAPEPVRLQAVECFARLRPHLDGEPPEMGAAEPELSFRLAHWIDDLDFRQQLLVSRSERDRLRRVIDFIPTYIGRRLRTSHVRAVAPRNGHGTPPPAL